MYTTSETIDLDNVDTNDLIKELQSRKYVIDTLTWWDIDHLMNLLPSNIKPGSEQYFIYEKLRVAKVSAKV